MKCSACGYEKRYEEYNIKKPIYYKSGKKKGQLKEIVDEVIAPFRGDPDFMLISFKQEKNNVDCYDKEDNDYYQIPIEIYACPKCSTLRIK